MRWLLIVLLVSLVTLLVASAGLAHHIWRQRTRQRSEASAAIEPAGKSDLEVKR